MKQKTGVFDVINVILLLAASIVCLYPMLYILFASFSDPAELIKYNGILLKPLGFSLAGYKEVVHNKEVFTGLANTLFYVTVGTTLSVLVTSMLAYPLSRPSFKYRRQLQLFIILTMFVSGGMIPLYLVVKGLGLLNTRWAIILPSLVSAYNLTVMRSSLEQLPISLEESAKLDGANDFVILFRIILPLSKAIVAVMVLFYGVAQWNMWFNASIYLKDRSLYPLQLFLREILINSGADNMVMDTSTGAKASLQQVIKYALIVVSTVPILIVYPFLQKYFVKGVLLGAVKG